MLALSIVERIVDWIEPAYLVAGYAIVGGGVLLERSIFIGLIIPGDVILALGGIYAARGELDLALVIVLGTLGAIVGESIGYALGRRYGHRLVRAIPGVRRLDRLLDVAQEFFRRHGGKTVAIGRFATAAGAFIPFTAGTARMPYSRFLLFDVPAVAVWAAGITVFGYYFGKNVEFVDKVLSRFGLIVLGVLVAFVAAGIVLKRRRARTASAS